MKLKLWTIAAALLIISCTPPQLNPLYLGQGVVVGEVTDSSAILQTRLTASDTILNGDVPGRAGMARFVVATNNALDQDVISTPWQSAQALSDYIVKYKVDGLRPDQQYFYQVQFGRDSLHIDQSQTGTFRTNPGAESSAPVSFVVVTGMNYYHFHFGKYNRNTQYQGDDKPLGYPALASIRRLAPDYFIGTGDNVYFDHPAEKNYQRALERGDDPLPGYFNGKAAITEPEMRRKYHLQFAQLRFKHLFQNTATYWEKDDHDYRVNDGDPYLEYPISHQLGIKNFKEQLPVTDPAQPSAVTYRTHRLNKDLQIWLVEGRDYRSANNLPDGPDKTLWGEEQKAWLKSTIRQSDATFKLLISPTAMVGPDDAYKKDNHTNLQGFRDEGNEFFRWLQTVFAESPAQLSPKNFFILCGDRHWQYHAVHPSGYEEFSCGALVDANSRAGRKAGDPESTDPDTLIQQHYIQATAQQASGGFLMVTVKRVGEQAQADFKFYDEMGILQYQTQKTRTVHQ